MDNPAPPLTGETAGKVASKCRLELVSHLGSRLGLETLVQHSDLQRPCWGQNYNWSFWCLVNEGYLSAVFSFH